MALKKQEHAAHAKAHKKLADEHAAKAFDTTKFVDGYERDSSAKLAAHHYAESKHHEDVAGGRSAPRSSYLDPHDSAGHAKAAPQLPFASKHSPEASAAHAKAMDAMRNADEVRGTRHHAKAQSEAHKASADAYANASKLFGAEGDFRMAAIMAHGAGHENHQAAKLAKKAESKGSKLKAFAEQGKKAPSMVDRAVDVSKEQRHAQKLTSTAAMSEKPADHKAAAEAHAKVSKMLSAEGYPKKVVEAHEKRAAEHSAKAQPKMGDAAKAGAAGPLRGQIKKAGPSAQIQTSAKGAKYYVNKHGEKVYVK